MRNLLHLSFLLIVAGALVTFFAGERGYITMVKTGEPAYVEEIELPFTVELIDCKTVYHAGSRAPKDYYTDITIDGVPQPRISMNKILRYKGYRFYQSNMLKDDSATLLTVSRDPWGIALMYSGFALFLIAGLGFFVQRRGGTGGVVKRSRIPLVAAAFVIIAVLCTVWVWVKWGNPSRPLPPVLNSPLLSVHVSVIMIAYALFLIMAVVSAVALCMGRRRQERRARLAAWNRMMLFLAVYLLGLGIILGSVWANLSWGRYWGWDPKETWALITMLLYALPLHGRSIKWFRTPWHLHLYLLLAILSVAFTWFGVNLLLPGLHSYA